ncbi:hypothetical protein [Trueperella bialowiezensis]|uniref:Lipoprotein n=1 Tax=Trueperella bialowiezensis TaxID=312285 RepID=A0A448PFQ1_9ACTO|nr:hypothetical protein [Trueperella bialowiezensis]VEI13775.1 Uncharacterised protein [Trueperella bialowiezensis]
MMRKLTATLAGAALLLAGCSSGDSVPSATSGNAAHEVIDAEKYTQIATEAKESIDAANASLDPESLTNRIGGPARTYRGAQLKLESLLGDSYSLDPMPVEVEAEPISSGSAFPRTMITAVAPRDGRNLSTLSVWSQNDPRSNYQLWADVELFPGVKVPDLVNQLNDKPGFPEVEAGDYAVDPSKVLEQYALYNGTRQQQQIVFTEGDPLFHQIAAQQDTFVQSLGDLGTAATNFAVGESGVRGVSTENGGLVIVGEMTYDVVITKTAEGATLRIGGEIGALHANSGENAMLEISHEGRARYATTVAFYVPPAGQDAVVSVIGASKPTLISVENVAPEE